MASVENKVQMRLRQWIEPPPLPRFLAADEARAESPETDTSVTFACDTEPNRDGCQSAGSE